MVEPEASIFQLAQRTSTGSSAVACSLAKALSTPSRRILACTSTAACSTWDSRSRFSSWALELLAICCIWAPGTSSSPCGVLRLTQLLAQRAGSGGRLGQGPGSGRLIGLH